MNTSYHLCVYLSLCVREKETDRRHLVVAAFGRATGSRLLVFYSEFVCLYIVCSIIKN